MPQMQAVSLVHTELDSQARDGQGPHYGTHRPF